MLTKTTVCAVRILLHLHLRGDERPISPRELATRLEESPTYLAKVARRLVRAGILRALRGVAGGVILNRSAEETTLLSVVEACQGTILGSFCRPIGDLRDACAFHRARAELHEATIGVLSRWTLKDLLRAPCSTGGRGGKAPCRMEPLGVPQGWRAPRSSSGAGALSPRASGRGRHKQGDRASRRTNETPE